MAFLVVALAFLLLALGTPIFAVFLMVAMWGATVTARGTFWEDFSGQMQDIAKLGTGEPATVLSTIPLFIFAGFLMAESKTADRILQVSRAWLGWLPGGLAVVTILACAIFTTFTGASGVTIVALGGLLMPSLLKDNYPQKFSLGLVAGTGSVGLLFPPALPLFVYGTVYGIVDQLMRQGGADMGDVEFSTDRFVFAGIVPGLVLMGILILYSMATAVKHKVPRHPFEVDKLWRPLAVALPEILIPFGIIFALAKGVGIPEISAIAVVYVFVLETLVYRDLKLAALWKVVRESMALVGAIFIIIFAAQAFTNFLITAEVPTKLVHWITDTFESKWAFLLGLNILLLVVGMLMDIFSAIVVVVPLIAPAAMAMGIDPYHLGVIFLLNLEIGYLTPPVGLNLFITGFNFRKPILEVVRASMPFLVCMLIALAIVTYVPALTVVPDKERRGRVAQLAGDVEKAFQEIGSVDEITAPDGKVMKRSDCETIEDELARGNCTGLFIDVTKCRAGTKGAVGSECETSAIKAYLDTVKAAADDSWEDEEDEDAGSAGGDEEDEEEADAGE